MTSTKHPLNFMLICLLILALGALAVTAMASAPGDIRFERHSSDSPDAEAQNSSFPPSIFPHWVHRINYRCDACHDSLFEMSRGGTPVTMELIEQGESCGVCHNGKLAFATGINECHLCHTAIEE